MTMQIPSAVLTEVAPGVKVWQATGTPQPLTASVFQVHLDADQIDAWPTNADRAAGIQAAIDSALAGALRLLARKHLGELDHAHLPTKDEPVSIVAVDNVGAWLEGWAVRIENGANL